MSQKNDNEHTSIQPTDYRCVHCNKWRSDHQEETLNCPMRRGGRGLFRGFRIEEFYEANKKKPNSPLVPIHAQKISG